MAAKQDQPKTTTIIFHQPDEGSQNRSYCDPKWLVVTLEGWLKLFQWFTTLLSFTPIVGKMPRIHHYYPEYNFMVFVGAVSWVFVSVHILLRITHMFDKMPSFFTNRINRMICCLVGVLAFLIASSVVSVFSYSISFLEASAAFGYITTFLFLLECLVLLAQNRRGQPIAETPLGTVEVINSTDQPQYGETATQRKEFRRYSQ